MNKRSAIWGRRLVERHQSHMANRSADAAAACGACYVKLSLAKPRRSKFRQQVTTERGAIHATLAHARSKPRGLGAI